MESDPIFDAATFSASIPCFVALRHANTWQKRAGRCTHQASRYLPDLQLYDPYVSKELTVRDLLTHRSGLARGDLMWFAGGYDRDEILRRVRFLRPSWSVRSQFGYQNIMYLAQGRAVAKTAGKSWDDLIRERIFMPLGMNESITSVRALEGKTNDGGKVNGKPLLGAGGGIGTLARRPAKPDSTRRAAP